MGLIGDTTSSIAIMSLVTVTWNNFESGSAIGAPASPLGLAGHIQAVSSAASKTKYLVISEPFEKHST